MLLGGLWNVILWELLELVGCIVHLTLIKWSHCWTSVARAPWYGVMTLLDLFWRGCEWRCARCHLAVSPCVWSPTDAEVLDLNNFLWQGVPQWIVFAYPVFLASFPLVSFSRVLVLWNLHKTFFTLFLSRSCLYLFLPNNASLWYLLNYIYSLYQAFKVS